MIWLFFIFLTIVGPQVAANQYAHPSLKSKEKTVRKLLLLPPRVQIQRQGMKGSEGMIKEAGDFGQAVSSLVAGQLAQEGCEVIFNQAVREPSTSDENTKFALTDIQNKYDRIEAVISRKPKDVRKGRFSIGDDVLAMNLAERGDALVFVRVNGIVLTKGRKIFGLLVPGTLPWSTVFISIALVDSKTGDVLYFSKIKAIGDFVGAPEQVLSKPVRKSFKNFRA
jgi:hypothetical protein